MRMLADENVAGAIVEALRQRGHDVAWVRTEAPGSADRDILQRAAHDERLVLTFDKDFGELAFRFRLPAASGIMLLRVTARSPSLLTSTVVAALESREDWSGHFSVIAPDPVRMTPLA